MTKMYLSYETMVALGIVNHNFPLVDQFRLSINPNPSKKPSTDESTGGIGGATKINQQVCKCLKQYPVTDCVTGLPFICTSENNDRMRN